jgi:hypothetical protein
MKMPANAPPLNFSPAEFMGTMEIGSKNENALALGFMRSERAHFNMTIAPLFTLHATL